MEKKISPAAPVVLGLAPAPAPPAPSSHAAIIENDAADLRLVIEEDPDSGLFVYKTVDRRTGDVLQQFPRDEVIRMHRAQDYVAGAIIKAKA